MIVLVGSDLGLDGLFWTRVRLGWLDLGHGWVCWRRVWLGRLELGWDGPNMEANLCSLSGR